MSMTQKETGNYDWAMRRLIQLEAEVTELTAVLVALTEDNHQLVEANTHLRGTVKLLTDMVHGVETVTTPSPKAPKLHSVKA